MRVALYLFAIVVANVVTSTFQPLQLGAMIVPAGTLLIGFTFIMRDVVQNQIGRCKTYYVIVVSLVISAVSAHFLGDALWIVFASAVSFTVSETCDTEIYTRLKTTMSKRILYSGLVGGLLDSSIFVIVGLSPIGAGFVPWDAVPQAIAGQVIVKSVLQLAGASIVKYKFERA